MQKAMDSDCLDVHGTGRYSLAVLRRWRRHEWRSLQGHLLALSERVRVARSARTLDQLLHDQWDLLPESRRRLQRNAETRRVLLAELVTALRRMPRGQR